VENIMSKKFIAALLVAGTAVLAAPAFASGYGPAPHYNAMDGAPASQRGQSAQTVAVEKGQGNVGVSSYGGVATAQSEESGHMNLLGNRSLYSHR
jgi:hypothetical protein